MGTAFAAVMTLGFGCVVDLELVEEECDDFPLAIDIVGIRLDDIDEIVMLLPACPIVILRRAALLSRYLSPTLCCANAAAGTTNSSQALISLCFS